MEQDSKGRRLVSVVRIIEYHGTDEWIKAVLDASRYPMQGRITTGADGAPFPEGCEIKSGLVIWNVMEDSGEVKAPVIPIPPSGRVM